MGMYGLPHGEAGWIASIRAADNSSIIAMILQIQTASQTIYSWMFMLIPTIPFGRERLVKD
jgi:hypothetical protein